MRYIYILLAAALLAVPAQSHAAACTKLSSDLSYGSNDATMKGQVKSLQNFLVSAGYMTVTPNGNFGPSTTEAVKKYQSAKGLPATGFVGSLTRFAIEYETCSSGATSNATQGTNVTNANTSTSNTAQTNSTPSNSITRPRLAESLMMGKNFTIKWTGSIKSDYALVLEDESGVTQGYIASYIGSSGQYVWKVGEVQVASDEKKVAPGNYRIRLQSQSFGRSNDDPISAVFKIEAPSVALSHLLPSSISADGRSAVVLYGSGFFGTTIYLGEWYRNSPTILFASEDGKILVFSVPETIPQGRYDVIIRNQYGSYTISSPQLTVTK